MILRNIPFNEFLLLGDRDAAPYLFAYSNGEKMVMPINHFSLKDIDQFTFGQVKDGIYNLENGIQMQDIPDFISLFTLEDVTVYLNCGVLEVMQQFTWLKKELETVIRNEKKRLSRPLTQKEIMAGIELFSEYGSYPQFEALAIRFSQTIEWVRNQPYCDMFLSMCYNKTLQDYELRYGQLK